MEDSSRLVKLYFHAHLGVGDLLIYTGLIRKLSEVYEEVIVPTRKLNRPTIERLYAGNPRITVLNVLGDYENKEQAFIHSQQGYEVLDGVEKVIDLNEGGYVNPGIGAGVTAYLTAGYHMYNSWVNFYFERNLESENEVYDYVVGDSKEDYAFCQLDINKLNPEGSESPPNEELLPDMRIVEPYLSDEIPLVDYLKVIKNAKEVHVMDSSFACLIDRCYPSKSNMFNHKYMRWVRQVANPTMMLGNWSLYLGENPPPEMDLQDYNKTIRKYFGDYNEGTNKFGVDLW